MDMRARLDAFRNKASVKRHGTEDSEDEDAPTRASKRACRALKADDKLLRHQDIQQVPT